MEQLNEMIKAIKDTYVDMISACDIEIKKAERLKDFDSLQDFTNLKVRFKIKMVELDHLLKT